LVEFLGRHVFLAVNLIGLLGVALAIAASGRHRGGVIAAGAIQTLHAPLTPLFDGIYWSPPRLGALPVGIEDILLCFCLGAGVWFSATRPWRNRIAHGAGLRQVLLRIATISLIPIAPGLLVRSAGASLMETLIFAMVATATVLAALRPALLRLSCAAIVLYPPYYLLIAFSTAGLFPGFFAIWDGPELWGPRLFGLPVDEIAWVGSYALCYPLIFATALDVRFAEAPGAATPH
jgi:hypothetical protein